MDAFQIWMCWVMAVVLICVIASYIGYFQKRKRNKKQ